MPTSITMPQHQVQLAGETAYNWPTDDRFTLLPYSEAIFVDRFTGENFGTNGYTGAPTWMNSVDQITYAIKLNETYSTRELITGIGPPWAPLGNRDVTIAAWIYLEPFGAYNTERSLFSYGPFFDSNSWMCWIDTSDNTWHVFIRGPSGSIEYTNSHNLSAETWHHVGWTIDRSEGLCKYYLNGGLANQHDLGSDTIDNGYRGDAFLHFSRVGQFNLRGSATDIWFVNGYAATANEMLQIYKYLGR